MPNALEQLAAIDKLLKEALRLADDASEDLIAVLISYAEEAAARRYAELAQGNPSS